MQVDPVKPTSKSPGSKLLKMPFDGPASNFAFKINVRRYTKVQQPGIPTGAGKRKTAEDGEALTAGAAAVAAGITAAVTGAAAAMAKGGVKLPTAKKAKLAKAASAVAEVGAALSAAAPDGDDSSDSDDDMPLSAMLPTPPAKKKPGPKSKAGPLTASLACSTGAAS